MNKTFVLLILASIAMIGLTAYSVHLMSVHPTMVNCFCTGFSCATCFWTGYNVADALRNARRKRKQYELMYKNFNLNENDKTNFPS